MVNEDGAAGPHRTKITLLILGSLAIALYGSMVGWGLPHATAPDRVKTWGTDELLPLEALAEMRSTFIESAADRNYGYPWFHYFVTASAQAPYLGYLWLSGGLEEPSAAYPFGLREPVPALRALTVIGRSVSVLMGAGIVLAAYLFAQTLWGHRAGATAAALTLINYHVFYFARVGNPDLPAFFWSAIGFVVFARILVGGLTNRRALWLGLFAGLAIATKDQSVLLFLPIGLALLLPRFQDPAGAGYRVKPLLAGLSGSVGAYIAATGMLVDPHRNIEHVRRVLFEPESLSVSYAYIPPYPRTMAGIAELLTAQSECFIDVMSLPVLVAFMVGVALVLRSSPRLLILLLPIVAVVLLLIIPVAMPVRRYLLPLTLVIDAFAALAVVRLRASRYRALWVPAIVLLCGARLMVVADMAWAQTHDSRYAAAEWFSENARLGEHVEYFGPTPKLPALPAEIETRRIAGREAWRGQTGHGPEVLRYLSSSGPEYVVIVPDWTSTSGMQHSGDCPPEVYEALVDGSAGYRLVAYWPTRTLLTGPFRRPTLDEPSPSPPFRIFARNEVADRLPESTGDL